MRKWIFPCWFYL